MLPTPRFNHVVFPAEKRRKGPLDLSSRPTLSTVSTGGEDPRFTGEQMALLRWLFAEAKLDLRAYRGETLLRRLPACLRLLRAPSPSHARRVLERNPSMLPAAVSVMLVGVTSFFRDPDVFSWLQAEVFNPPERGRPGFHVWSAGCSDGAELYSVAMQLAEVGKLERSYLLGTDCRSDAVERARSGSFEGAALKGVPPAFLSRYFARQGDRWHIDSGIRSNTRWAVSDLLKMLEPGAWDVILFRNAAMYFNPEPLAALWTRLECALRPGGVLVLGRAERPSGTKRLWPVRMCVFRRLRS